jgi:GNAT superfamily N-acetyltransferase
MINLRKNLFGGTLMSMYFEEVSKETLYIALEIINSNSAYNVLENGKMLRTLADIEGDFINPNTIIVFIKLDDTYIGLLDYLMENPNDQQPWLGLLMIHGDYHGNGFGTQAYAQYENEMIERGLQRVRIGVFKDNVKANTFWKSLGFSYFKTVTGQNGNEILCYEKVL